MLYVSNICSNITYLVWNELGTTEIVETVVVGLGVQRSLWQWHEIST